MDYSFGWLGLSLAALSSSMRVFPPRPSLVAHRPAAFKDKAELTVSWTGTTVGHWVGAWSPPNYSIPVKRARVNTSTGDVTFELLNIRHPVVFRLTDQEPHKGEKVEVLAESDLIEPENLPMQIRTSVTSVVGDLQIMFVDNSSAVPFVKYGYAPNALDQKARGTSTTISLQEFVDCGSADTTAIRRFYDPGHIHTVLLKNLEPGTPLYYRVGHGEGQWSDPIRHVGAAPHGRKAVNVLYFADMGVGPARWDEIDGALDLEGESLGRENAGMLAGGRLVFESLMKVEGPRLHQYDMVLHNGDISYSCGDMWIHEEWSAIVQPLAQQVPYMTSLGNHEYDHGTSTFPTADGRNGWAFREYGEDSGGECGIAYRKRFQMPEGTSSHFKDAGYTEDSIRTPAAQYSQGSETFKPYYSVNIGMVHFTVLSTETDFTVGSSQLDWLSQDLAAVNNWRTPWVVVAMHRHMYGHGDSPSVVATMQEALEPLFVEHNVDLVLTAHQHTYRRTCAMRYGECVSEGETAPVYIIDGSAGGYTNNRQTGEGRECPLPPGPFPEPIVAEDCQWGWSRLQADQTKDLTTLTWQHVRWNSGDISDSLILNKTVRHRRSLSSD